MHHFPLKLLYIIVDLVGRDFRRALDEKVREEPWKLKSMKDDRTSNHGALAALAGTCRALAGGAHAFMFKFVYLDNVEDADTFFNFLVEDHCMLEYVEVLDRRSSRLFYFAGTRSMDEEQLALAHTHSQARSLFPRMQRTHTLVLSSWISPYAEEFRNFWDAVAKLPAVRQLAFSRCKFHYAREPLIFLKSSDDINTVQTMQFDSSCTFKLAYPGTKITSLIPIANAYPPWTSLTTIKTNYNHMMFAFGRELAWTKVYKTLEHLEVDIAGLEGQLNTTSGQYHPRTYVFFEFMMEYFQRCGESLQTFTLRYTNLRMIDHAEAKHAKLWAELDLVLMREVSLNHLWIRIGVDCKVGPRFDGDARDSRNFEEVYAASEAASLDQMRDHVPELAASGRLLVYQDDAKR